MMKKVLTTVITTIILAVLSIPFGIAMIFMQNTASIIAFITVAGLAIIGVIVSLVLMGVYTIKQVNRTHENTNL